MAGIDLPLLPTEHQYFVTETIPEIAAMDRRLPSVADRDGEYYLRQEGRAFWSAPMRRTCASGPRTARRRASATSCSPTIWSGSRRT
jgi:glycine/D-amino acid oxidase-like deaminating enzyme